MRCRRVSVEISSETDELVVRLHGEPIRLPAPLMETLFALGEPGTRSDAMTRLRGRLACSESELQGSIDKLLALRFIRARPAPPPERLDPSGARVG